MESEDLPAKIVLATIGTYGDLHPFIGIARRLKDSGHEPVIGTSAHFRDKVEAEGIGFHATRPHEAQVVRDLGLDTAGIARQMMKARLGGLGLLTRRLILPYLRQTFDDMMHATKGASLVITSSLAYGARLAAEVRGLPHINIVLQPVMFTSAYDPPAVARFPWLRALHPELGRRLTGAMLGGLRRLVTSWAGPIHEMRHELGLPSVHANPLLEGQFSPDGTIALYSSVLGDIQPDFPPNTSIAGFSFYDSGGGGPERLDAELEKFLVAGARPLIFTLGSAAVLNAGTFYTESLAAARRLKKRAVLLVGTEMRERFPAMLDDDVMVRGYAPYSLVFPRAEAIIHHGGIGTTGQALRSGRPQLVVPFWGDQPDNAERVVRIGVGRMVARQRYRAQRVAGELSELLGQPSYVARAAEVGRIIEREDGAGEACRIVEEVLRRRGPNPRGQLNLSARGARGLVRQVG